MRRPTGKQLKFIGQYISNGCNATEAALVTYDTADYATAKSIGSENLTKPYIRREIDRLMKRENLSVSEAFAAIREALHAKGANGKPNWSVRLKAADMILKLSDAYPKTGAAENPQETSIYNSPASQKSWTRSEKNLRPSGATSSSTVTSPAKRKEKRSWKKSAPINPLDAKTPANNLHLWAIFIYRLRATVLDPPPSASTWERLGQVATGS